MKQPQYDLTFIGHVCFDEILHHDRPTVYQPGSAVLCGAMAAVRTGKRVQAILKLNPADIAGFAAIGESGADVAIIPAAKTTRMRVIHPSDNVDDREMVQLESAEPITVGELPTLSTRQVHLAGVTDQEFTLDLIRHLRSGPWTLSADMQSFVRQVNLETRHISFADVPAKKQIVALLDSVKLDIVEAKMLTGSDDLATAAGIIQSWGCKEVVITQAQGVLSLAEGKAYYQKFSNSTDIGRTGRGDTTFAAYLSWRQEHDVEESLRFAAALVSLKMETPGPFQGTLEHVLVRMRDKHAVMAR